MQSFLIGTNHFIFADFIFCRIFVIYTKSIIMTTITINDKIKGAKEIIRYLKTLSFVKVVDEKEKIPNAKTIKAFEDIEEGRIFKADSLEDLYEQLEI